jgi:prevent-host-death family protein
MNVIEDIRPISYVKANAAQILDQINMTHRPMFITQNGEAKAVIMDPQSYQRLNDGLKLMKLVSQSEEEFSNGKGIPHKEVFKRLESKFAKK